MNQQADTEKKSITYIIGVHGIGEQRENESLLPIINGFARVRECQNSTKEEKEHLKNNKKAQKIYRPLTQGMLSSQKASTPWVEFKGIPSIPGVCSEKFIGRPVQNGDCGENFRFVDMHWADIMQDHFDDYGQPVETWTESLIDRLKLHNSDGSFNWIPELIESIRKGILPVKQLLTMKQRLLTGSNNTLNDTIFNRFLGDAQLYGEYTVTRAEAVYRFHQRMAEVHAAHWKEMEKDDSIGNPRYVVLAHSLGTIMSFDALIYAQGKKKNDPKTHLPILDLEAVALAGYQPHDHKDTPLQQPSMDWVPFVDTFISLGSPIDKYLLLWWMNYEHLIDKSWLETGMGNVARSPAQVTQKTKIQHYNYCDEQDPVGHELDTAYSAEVVRDIFEIKEDAVFMRYKTPGVAHIDYWKDLPLLRHIVNNAIDRLPEKIEAEKSEKNGDSTPNITCEIDWFKKEAYSWALMWSYFFIPSVGLILSLIMFAFGYESSTNIGKVIFYSIGVGIFGFSLWGMKLMIRWRQLSQCARPRASKLQKNDPTVDQPTQDNKTASTPENVRDIYTTKNTQDRNVMRAWIRGIISGTPLIWVAIITLLIHFTGAPNPDSTIHTLAYAISIGGLLISSLNLFWYTNVKLQLTGGTGLPKFLDTSITKLFNINKKTPNEYSLKPYRKYILGEKKFSAEEKRKA